MATTSAASRKLLANPQAISKALTGLRVRPAADYAHHWRVVPGVPTASPKTSFAGASSDPKPTVRTRWTQSRVSARTLADLRKKCNLLERSGIVLATHPETGKVVPPAVLLNLPPPKGPSTKTVRMGKPDKGRKHDRTASERKAKVAKAIADMPKTIETWKKTKDSEKTKTKSTLPF